MHRVVECRRGADDLTQRWLPTLPAERLEIIRRCIPGHGVTARPIDLFNSWPPRQWLVTDQRSGPQRRDVLGLFNWSAKAEELSVPLAGLGLPEADQHIAFDFWNRVRLGPFKGNLRLSVPAAACRILAVRPLLPRPFLLSTSRRGSPGILEVGEGGLGSCGQDSAGRAPWWLTTSTNSGLSPVLPMPNWSVVKAEVSAEDKAAGVTIKAGGTNGLVRAVIRSPVSRDVAWTLRFMPGKITAALPSKPKHTHF